MGGRLCQAWRRHRAPLAAALAPGPASLLVFIVLSSALTSVHGCTSIVVGKHASADGSIYICRTQDAPTANFSQSILYHPPRDTLAHFSSQPPSPDSADSSFSTLLPASGLSYIAFPDSYTLKPGQNASFEEVGVNSAGVAVSATETIFSNDAVLTVDPLNETGGIAEEHIPSIILPQATTARHAVQLLGRYIEQYGSAEGFGVLFADSTEAWYLENAGGHLWLAQRVPHDTYFVSANQGRLQEVDLEDTASVLSSPDLLGFAVRHGLHDPAAGQPFNWLRAVIADTPHDHTYNYPRVAYLQAMFGAGDVSAPGPYFPVFQQPARPIGVLDLMDGLRHHYQGTQHDPYLHQNPGEPWRPVAVMRTAQAHVTRVRTSASLPDALSVINYICTTSPFLAPFVPIYKGLAADALPAALKCADGNTPDDSSLFWKARRMQALVLQNWPALGPRSTAAIRAWERDVEERQRPAFELRYSQLWEAGSREEAAKVLSDFTADVVSQAGSLLDELAGAAAAALGMNELAPDAELAPMLWHVADAYLFHGA